MQSTPAEPTLTDVVETLQDLSANVKHLSTEVGQLKTDVELSNERFETYQKAVQWVVQLAFSLIASATVTVIITSVLRQ